MPRERGWVRCELGEIIQDLLVLQFRQAASLVDRALSQPPGRAAGRNAQTSGEEEPREAH
jgi:hypothetical protein